MKKRNCMAIAMAGAMLLGNTTAIFANEDVRNAEERVIAFTINIDLDKAKEGDASEQAKLEGYKSILGDGRVIRKDRIEEDGVVYYIVSYRDINEINQYVMQSKKGNAAPGFIHETDKDFGQGEAITPEEDKYDTIYINIDDNATDFHKFKEAMQMYRSEVYENENGEVALRYTIEYHKYAIDQNDKLYNTHVVKIYDNKEEKTAVAYELYEKVEGLATPDENTNRVTVDMSDENQFNFTVELLKELNEKRDTKVAVVKENGEVKWNEVVYIDILDEEGRVIATTTVQPSFLEGTDFADSNEVLANAGINTFEDLQDAITNKTAAIAHKYMCEVYVIEGTEVTNIYEFAKDIVNDDMTTDEPVQSITQGWVNNNGTWVYYNELGEKVTGWEKIEHKGNDEWFFFNEAGEMQTGWQSVNGTWYYMAANGVMLTGWINDNGTWYYAAPNGAMQTGWVFVDGEWYFLAGNGAMQTGWINDNGTWYYAEGNGTMVRGWKEIQYKGKVEWFFFNENGSMASDTVVDGWSIDSNGVATQL